MRNVNLYSSGSRGRIGQQARDQIGLNPTIPFALKTPKSAWASGLADMVRALTAKSQENREKEDMAAHLAAISKRFDPSAITPLAEDSPYLSVQRENMAQALAGTPQSPLGGSADNVFEPQAMPVDGMQPSSLGVSADDVLLPATGVEPFRFIDPSEGEDGAAVDAGTRAEDEAAYMAEQYRNRITPREAVRNLTPQTKAGRDAQYAYELSRIDKDETAQLLAEERAFMTFQARKLAESKNAEARAGGSSETWGKTPVWGTDAEGNDVLGVISDGGNFKEIEVPEGFNPDRDITGDKALETARVERLTKRVDKGIAAAESLPILKRSLELLRGMTTKGVKTGGFASMQIKVRRLFGVQGANEAELSYALGKSVLSQLKATFGAAFTAGEAEKLERLEAGLSQSPEGNIRIIENLIRQSEQFYRQGRKAAFDSDDLSTYESMADSYGLTYGPSGDDDVDVDGNGNGAGKSSRPNPSNYTGTDAQWNALSEEDQDLYLEATKQ
jgi:hypothetical protein